MDSQEVDWKKVADLYYQDGYADEVYVLEVNFVDWKPVQDAKKSEVTNG